MALRLHPKQGLNASLDTCFWCGEPKGVALLGYTGNKAAPRKVVTSFEPCDDCAAGMAKGITCIEVVHARHDEPQLSPGFRPTGSWSVVTEEAALRVFRDYPELPRVIETRKALLSSESYAALFGAGTSSAKASEKPH